MRPNAHKFRRNARQVVQRPAVHTRSQLTPSHAPQTEAAPADHGLRWISVDRLKQQFTAPDHILLKCARAVEQSVIDQGSIGLDTFQKYARFELLKPRGWQAAFMPLPSPVLPIPQPEPVLSFADYMRRLMKAFFGPGMAPAFG